MIHSLVFFLSYMLTLSTYPARIELAIEQHTQEYLQTGKASLSEFFQSYLALMQNQCSSNPESSTPSQKQNGKHIQTGTASWYGPRFHGKETANGEIFDQDDLTAAHKTIPFGTKLHVENLSNGKSVVVRINDRGPFLESRVLDLSKEAARRLDMIDNGIARVRLSFLDRASGSSYFNAKLKEYFNIPSQICISLPYLQSDNKTEFSSLTFKQNDLTDNIPNDLIDTTVQITSSNSDSQPPPLTDNISSGRFYIQLGAFSESDNAEKTINYIKTTGYTYRDLRQGKFTIVQLGPYSSQNEAKTVHVQFKAKFPDSFIVRNK